MKKRTKRDNKNSVMGIYKINNNINEKVYIGSSINIEKRIKTHIRELNANTHNNSELQNDWNLYKSDSFSFELIESVEDKTLLPEIEQKYIDLYRSEKEVYNKSNPIEEFDHRNTRKKKQKQKKGIKRIVTYAFVVDYINENYKELGNNMKDGINKRKYYYKDIVDNWIINDIKNEDVKNDDRLINALHKWYNKELRFAVIKSNMYKKEFKELFGIIVESNKELLVSDEVNRQLYKKKISKFRN